MLTRQHRPAAANLSGVTILFVVLALALMLLPAMLWRGSGALRAAHEAEIPPLPDSVQRLVTVTPSAPDPIRRPERRNAPDTNRSNLVNSPQPAPTHPVPVPLDVVTRSDHPRPFPDLPDLPGLSTEKITDLPDRSPAARRAAAERFGGDARTEDAVELGLAWLAAHQEADGSWGRMSFERLCPRNDRCGGPALARTQFTMQAGLTGLVLLAFQGAGYADDDDGPYRANVDRALEFLLRSQQPDGGFAGSREMAGYNNTLAAFALTEHYRLTRRDDLRPRVEAAVRKLAISQQQLGGWDYREFSDSGRNDTSITGWAVQTLAAAVGAGIEPPSGALLRSALHFDRAADVTGQVWYSDVGTGFRLAPDTFEPQHRFGPAMAAVGLMSQTMLGWRSDLGRAAALRGRLLSDLPADRVMRNDPTGLHDYYYWYYGTLAMFQQGGAGWERWNAHLRDALLPLQDRTESRRGVRGHSHGSWPPYGAGWGKWGRMGGRVYTTAIAVLTLEVYYRQPPDYLQHRRLIRAGDWRAYLESAPRREVLRAIDLMSELRIEVSEPVLVELLDSRDDECALRAALILSRLDSPLPRRVLSEALEHATEWERRVLEAAMDRCRRVSLLPPVRGVVRYVDEDRGLATVELPRAYLGMLLSFADDDSPADQPRAARPEMRVVQRFADRSIVVAELLGGRSPRSGDQLLGR